MNRLLVLLLLTVGLSAAVPTKGGHHRGAAGHEENCVDISRYSELQYNITNPEICTYQVNKKCETYQQQVCTSVPVTTCQLQPSPECSQSPIQSQIIRNDKVQKRQYTSKTCSQAGTQTISQTKQRPVCKKVTKPQHCESKWVINDLGEKVWDGNENCQTETTEECSLESYLVPIQVPVYNCQDGEVITYEEPVASTEEVTAYSSHCKPAASPVCSTTSKQECIQVEYQDCIDQIVPQCQASQQTFQIPYQTFDHRLKCLV
jgi:hypothetical protein